ncbi:hypothetical protein RND81_01G068900 [Saponaria officinalis]|uniref:SHSP domain-containing protein n=1 Tax=Saponaria officinalis TaxID=3572 RepID=A0AAW1N645_SAPOF
MGGIEEMMNVDQSNTLRKILNSIRADITNEDKSVSSPLTDIVSTAKEYIFYIDVPGISKSDIQVQVEDENVIVIRSNGKRKRDDADEKGCRYLKLERSAVQKMMRKFRLPQDADVGSISAKCENGVLTVTVAKVPPSKPKTVQVAVS